MGKSQLPSTPRSTTTNSARRPPNWSPKPPSRPVSQSLVSLIFCRLWAAEQLSWARLLALLWPLQLLTLWMMRTARQSCKFLLWEYCRSLKSSDCYSVVAMVSMAFGIVGLIACICCKDVDHKMTNKVRTIFRYWVCFDCNANLWHFVHRLKFISKTLLLPKGTSTINSLTIGSILDIAGNWWKKSYRYYNTQSPAFCSLDRAKSNGMKVSCIQQR